MAAAATATAFERGVEVVLLTAATEYASRVYQRVGFSWYGTGLAYAEEE
jgi:predicted GNAT family acetyltransferase